MKISCTICRELFLSAHIVLVTNCGHLYHKECIGQWAQKHHSCPQCRAKLVFQPIRVFFNIEDDLNSNEEELLETKYSEATEKLCELTIKEKVLTEKLAACLEECHELTQKATKANEQYSLQKLTIASLQKEISHSKILQRDNEKLKLDYSKIVEENSLMKSIDVLLKGSELTVKNTLKNTPCTPKSLQQLITYIEVLKQQSVKNSDRYKKMFKSQKPLLEEVSSLKRENESLKSRIEGLELQFENSTPKCPPSTPPSSNECIDLCTPVVPDVRIKLLDRLEVLKRSSFLRNPSRLPVGRRMTFSPTSATSPSPGYVYDGMGGSKRISLATTTPAADLIRIRAMKHLSNKPKKTEVIEKKTKEIINVSDAMDISNPDEEFIELD